MGYRKDSALGRRDVPMPRSKSQPLALACASSASLHALVGVAVTWAAGSAAPPSRTDAPLLLRGDTWEIEAVELPEAHGSSAQRQAAPSAPGAPASRDPTVEQESRTQAHVEAPPARLAVQRTQPVGTLIPPSAPLPPPTAPIAPTGGATGAAESELPTTGDSARAAAPAGAVPALGGEQESTDPRRRSLAKEFTRMLPRAGHADPFWSAQPLGFFDTVRIRLELDDEGQLQSIVGEPRELGSHWKRLLERTRLFLKMGRFVLATLDGEKEQALKLTARVGDRPSLREESYDPKDSVELSSEPPAPGHPGKARFSYPSGRQVEITVELIP